MIYLNKILPLIISPLFFVLSILVLAIIPGTFTYLIGFYLFLIPEQKHQMLCQLNLLQLKSD